MKTSIVVDVAAAATAFVVIVVIIIIIIILIWFAIGPELPNVIILNIPRFLHSPSFT